MTAGAASTPTPASTNALLDAAAAVAPGAGGGDAALESFASLYLDWILAQRGMSRQTADRREKTSFMLHCLVGAKSLGEALQLYARFSDLLWGDAWLTGIREQGETVEMILNPPLPERETGLLAELWNLALTLSELEWLVCGRLDGVAGRVRAPELIDRATVALFFGRPIAFGASELALTLPRQAMSRGVTARTRDIERFCISLPLTTLAGGGLQAPQLRILVASLIRKNRLQAAPIASTLNSVAAQLGRTPGTLRRQLQAEGATFRGISEEVLNDLAQGWLADSKLTIEAVADRLGYSDAFAFRRWFRRRHGCSPSAFRRALLTA
jgi:AraC-like DNA-binding protein